MALLEYIVPGIGLNVNEVTADFPQNIQKIAGSLVMGVGKPVQRGPLVAEIVNSLDRMYAAWLTGKGDYLERYRAACITLGKEVQILRTGQEPRVAFAEDIDDHFRPHCPLSGWQPRDGDQRGSDGAGTAGIQLTGVKTETQKC